jgi:hypothetical protein
VALKNAVDMSVIKEFSQMPYSGLPVDDVAAALDVFRSAPNVGNEQIINIAVRDDGKIMIRTGEMRGQCAGGGRVVVLVRRAAGWVIRESGYWAS